MNEWLDDLRLAVGMLTRIPMSHPHGAEPPYVGRAHRLFPIVGAGIGAAIGLIDLGLSSVGIPAFAAAALALGAGMLLTGAFHEDGLADLADGFGGGRDKAGKLEIMRDSRLGTFGALALVATFGAKAGALAALPQGFVVPALAAAHALSRGPLPGMTLFLPYAREDGLAARAGKVDVPIAATSAVFSLIVAVACLPFRDVLLSVLVTVGACLAVAELARRQIGGYTGDVLGATQQVAETGLLVLLSASHG